MDQHYHEEAKRSFSGLEICRVGCAFAVILYHYHQFFLVGLLPAHPAMAALRQLPFYQVFGYFYASGHFAVPVFWVISGFIFFWKYGESIHARRTSTTAFFMLRFSRLYPLHFATLVLVALLQFQYIRSHGISFAYGDNDLAHFIPQLFLASNWLMSQPFTFNTPIWSVSLEILVYFLFFCLMLLVRPSVLQCILTIAFGKFLMHLHIEYIPSCACLFFTGGLLQRLERRLKQEHVKFVLTFSLVLAVVLFVANLHRLLPHSNWIEMIMAGLVVNIFVLLDRILPVVARVAWVGNLTYASYLLHFPVQLVMVSITDALHLPRGIYDSPLALGIYLAITFGLAWSVYWAYELPAQNLIRTYGAAIVKRPVAGALSP